MFGDGGSGDADSTFIPARPSARSDQPRCHRHPGRRDRRANRPRFSSRIGPAGWRAQRRGYFLSISPAPSAFDAPSTSSPSPATARARVPSGAVKLIEDLDHSIEGRNIVLVEDILDTGLALSSSSACTQHRPRSLPVATLLDKPDRRLEPIQAEYVGFTIPNHFIRLWHRLRRSFRNLPDICIFPPDAAD